MLASYKIKSINTCTVPVDLVFSVLTFVNILFVTITTSVAVFHFAMEDLRDDESDACSSRKFPTASLSKFY